MVPRRERQCCHASRVFMALVEIFTFTNILIHPRCPRADSRLAGRMGDVRRLDG